MIIWIHMKATIKNGNKTSRRWPEMNGASAAVAKNSYRNALPSNEWYDDKESRVVDAKPGRELKAGSAPSPTNPYTDRPRRDILKFSILFANTSASRVSSRTMLAVEECSLAKL